MIPWKPTVVAGLVLILAALAGLGGCAGRRPPPAPRPSADARALLGTAHSQLGTPYRYGGESPETGFDCSGFTRWVYGRHGVSLPRRSRDQKHAGNKVPKRDLKEADLVFFHVDRKGSLHVGIYAGDENFIHSPSSGGRIRKDSLRQRYWDRSFLEGRRILP